ASKIALESTLRLVLTQPGHATRSSTGEIRFSARYLAVYTDACPPRKDVLRMRTKHILCGLVSLAILLLSHPLLAAIQLTTVVSGLSSPVFVGHAGDGSNRLFIEEQIGTIKVLQPGASTPTAFLDIHTKILAGGERGLLGLAFHPQYALNRRFFVYYT